jgi:hypothetical protein
LVKGVAGFGSYEAVYYRNSVVSAQMVLPDRTIKDFSGSELDLVADAEGVTGDVETGGKP